MAVKTNKHKRANRIHNYEDDFILFNQFQQVICLSNVNFVENHFDLRIFQLKLSYFMLNVDDKKMYLSLCCTTTTTIN